MVAMNERVFTVHHLPINQKESPALNNAGLSNKAYSISLYGKDSPSCLAVCFSWPQVALTHHVCSKAY